MKIEFFTLLLQVITMLGGVAFWFAILKKDLELIKKDVGKIEGMEEYIKNLSNYFKDGNFKGIPNRLKEYKSRISNYYTSNSPLRLNKQGEDLVKESGFDKIVEQDNRYLIEDVKRVIKGIDENKLFYYIEKESIDLVKKLDKEDDKIMEPVGLYIFKNGLLDDKKDILNALGLYLRDRVIQDLGLEKEFNKLFDKEKKD